MGWSCRLPHDKPGQPIELNFSLLLTGSFVLSTKKEIWENIPCFRFFEHLWEKLFADSSLWWELSERKFSMEQMTKIYFPIELKKFSQYSKVIYFCISLKNFKLSWINEVFQLLMRTEIFILWNDTLNRINSRKRFLLEG